MNNIFSIFEANVKKYPNKKAIIFNEDSLTYEELYTEVKRVSSAFYNMGIKKSTHVALFSNNSLEYGVIMLSIAYLGATIIPLPLTLKGKSRKNLLDKTDCEFVIAWHSVVNELLEDRVFLKENFVSLGKKIDNIFFYTELSGDVEFKTPYEVQEDINYILTTTSGSTGEPKAIIFSQKNKIDRALIATRDIYHLNSDDVIMTSTPLYHSLAQRSLLLPILLGATSVILNKFTPKLWCETVEKYKVSFLFAVSTQLELLLNTLDVKEYDLSSLNTIVSSSALLKENVKQKLLANLDCKIYECYGASEVGVVTNLLISEKLGSVGKALPFVDLKIIDNEIVCKSLTEFKGYYKNDEANKSAYKDGYFCTGDIGSIEDDYLFYKGRIKEIIITGGINVYPKDIESLINQFKEVEECAVIGIEDSYFGEIPVAFITQKEGLKINIKEIRKECMRNLIDYQIPQKFIIVDSFPKSGLGKIMKHKIIDNNALILKENGL